MTARSRIFDGGISPSPRSRGRTLDAALVDSAAIVTAWGVLLVAENIAVGFLWREQFSASWEISLARHTVVPMALAALAPLSFAVLAGWRIVEFSAGDQPAARRVLGASGAIAAAAVAIGVSSGRHFAEPAVRAAFVIGLAAVGGLGGAKLLPRLALLSRQPVALGACGFVVTVAAWLADGYVLPRLYPSFHVGLLAATLLGSALVGIAFRVGSAPTFATRALAAVAACVVVWCAAWTPHAARVLERATNVRIALVEHAPLLGRAVIVASRLCPTNNEGAPSEAATAGIPGEMARSLDWTGHDLVLITVDALRADHVSSYGYSRHTTPNIDGLAREGALFEAAYCPTPHTSYSITSMLTGKYMRPLLTLGLGEDSETWAQALRRYGWRTAAFYPPAVFFIDEDRFTRFESEHLGFEYAKVEFADPMLREKQVTTYLEVAPLDVPIFIWVHFFEPHEPYLVHPEHVFHGSSSDVDAYDSEVAAADDGVGRIVRAVRSHRSSPVIVVTADHGEEFGEHGGHYHGTTVYEEQVRVPLVVVGPGVHPGQRLRTVVQTIDLLPTALSALGIPRPARLRGRDLGARLAGDPGGAVDDGFAFAETDDYALVAAGDDRLICERRAAACVDYRPKNDPSERRDVSHDDQGRFDALRAMLRAVERDHGRYESSGGPAWPEALRRGMQGEAEAALDVTSLLDDASVAIRRKAAEVCFRLSVSATIPAVKRALVHDEDDEVRRWSALALARMGESIVPLVDAMLRDPDGEWRRRSALVLAERGEGRGCDEIASWWADSLPARRPGREAEESPRLAMDLVQAEELLAATARARCRAAVPALVRALDDVRARPYVADALGAIGDERARPALLALFEGERYVTARPHEARALLSLGLRDWSATTMSPEVQTTLQAPRGTPSLRLFVLLSDAAALLQVSADGVPLADAPPGTEVRVLELAPPDAGRVRLGLRASSGAVVALWLVAAARLD